MYLLAILLAHSTVPYANGVLHFIGERGNRTGPSQIVVYDGERIMLSCAYPNRLLTVRPIHYRFYAGFTNSRGEQSGWLPQIACIYFPSQSTFRIREELSSQLYGFVLESCAEGGFQVNVTVTLEGPNRFTCTAGSRFTNPALGAPLRLKIHVEPAKPQIDGPETTKEGMNVTYTCTSSGKPPPFLFVYIAGEDVTYRAIRLPTREQIEVNKHMLMNVTLTLSTALYRNHLNQYIMCTARGADLHFRQSTSRKLITVYYGPDVKQSLNKYLWPIKKLEELVMICNLEYNGRIDWRWNFYASGRVEDLETNSEEITLRKSHVLSYLQPGEEVTVLEYTCMGWNLDKDRQNATQRHHVYINQAEHVTANVEWRIFSDEGSKLSTPVFADDGEQLRLDCIFPLVSRGREYLTSIAYSHDSHEDYDMSSFTNVVTCDEELTVNVIESGSNALNVDIDTTRCRNGNLSFWLTVQTGSPPLFRCELDVPEIFNKGNAVATVLKFEPLHSFTFTTNPANSRIIENNQVVFSCSTYGRPPPLLSFKLGSKELNDSIHQPPIASLSTYRVGATSNLTWTGLATKEMHGLPLTCKAMSVRNTSMLRETISLLIIHGPQAKINFHSHKYFNIRYQTSVVLTCDVNVYGNTTYQWFKNVDGSFIKQSSMDRRLVIDNLNYSQFLPTRYSYKIENYTCKVINIVDGVNKEIELSYIAVVYAFNDEHAELEAVSAEGNQLDSLTAVMEGDNITFNCHFPPTISPNVVLATMSISLYGESDWKQQLNCDPQQPSKSAIQNHPLANSPLPPPQEFSCSSGVLSARYMMQRNTPNYFKCNGSVQSILNFTSTVVVYTHTTPTPPLIEQSPVAEGDVMRLTCESSARPPPALQFVFAQKYQSTTISAVEPDNDTIIEALYYGTNVIGWSVLANKELDKQKIGCVLNHVSGVRLGSSFQLSVFYGPESSNSNSPTWIRTQNDLNLTCDLEGKGRMLYKWHHRTQGAYHQLDTTSRILLYNQDLVSTLLNQIGQEGTTSFELQIECAAYNLDNKNNTAFKSFFIQTQGQQSDGKYSFILILSLGGTTLVILAIILSIVYLVVKRSPTNTTNSRKKLSNRVGNVRM